MWTDRGTSLWIDRGPTLRSGGRSGRFRAFVPGRAGYGDPCRRSCPLGGKPRCRPLLSPPLRRGGCAGAPQQRGIHAGAGARPRARQYLRVFCCTLRYMTILARTERVALCDLFDRVGPEAPTLCEGWSTRDLAAHLVIREGRPDAALGIVIPLLASRTERIQDAVARRPWGDLVDAVRSGPPRVLRPVDEVMNTVEYFVHHEDVRRAGPGSAARQLDPALEDALWRRLRSTARLMFRRAGVSVELDAPGRERVRAGSGTETVRVSGAPSELVLFGFGRGSHAEVGLDGSESAVARLESASLGL